MPLLVLDPAYDDTVSSEEKKLGSILRRSGFIAAAEAQNVAVLISTELQIVTSYVSPDLSISTCSVFWDYSFDSLTGDVLAA